MTDNSRNRLLAELAPVRKVGEGSERRTGVYTLVHEDSSTEPTNKFSTGVELSKKSNVICILGPTATGKTKLAIALSQRLPAEIISVDSAMVYRGMDIGTAKPTKQELKIAPHRLIDICDPSDYYSAGQFCQDATREIEAIIAEDKVPILVGGTMLYFSLLQKGLSDLPDQNPQIRTEITRRAEAEGWDTLHKELEHIDPIAAKKIHPNDPQRIQRALELYYSTGETRTELQSKQKWNKLPYRFINIILVPKARSVLHQRIEQRFDKMLDLGFIDEVKRLYQRKDLSESLPSIRSVGYRQVWKYLKGEYDFETMRYKGIVATRQFAKRQHTWLKQFYGEHFVAENPNLLQDVLSYLDKNMLD